MLLTHSGLEADRYFGPRLEASIVFLKHQNHFSYERIVHALRELFGLEISEGCIQHQLQDLKRILDRDPELFWATQVRELFREAIHLKNRMISPSSDLTLNGLQRRVAQIGNRLDRLLECQLTDSDEKRLQNRFQIHREKLLIFLDYPDVRPTNNVSEQAIRTSVIHPKVANGFRSDWGAKAYADLLSVISTSKIKGQGVLTTLVSLMGPEVLSFFHT